MTEFFYEFEPFCMNFLNFRSHLYGFRQIEDTRSIQISSVVIKFLTKIPFYQNLGQKMDSYVGNFRSKTHPYERHVQCHSICKYRDVAFVGL